MNVFIYSCYCAYDAELQIQKVYQMLQTNEQHLVALDHLWPVLVTSVVNIDCITSFWGGYFMFLMLIALAK